jgi:hypoxanthine phosphoribosyltransferase
MNKLFQNNRKIFFEIKGIKSGYNYFSLFYYYSKKNFPTLPKEQQLFRELLWDFKDGNHSIEVSEIITSAILNLRSIDFSSFSACIIPASTNKKTKTRFFDFICNVCDILEIENGYSFIQVIRDHEQTKGNSSKNIIQYLKFNKEKIRNKSILLFDDVITSGQSFVQCANELKKFGAKKVIGIFIGKTYSIFKHGTPEWSLISEDNLEHLPSTYVETYRLIQNGYSIDDIAESRRFKEDTIIKHIVYLAEFIDIDKFLSIKPNPKIIQSVKNAILMTKEREKLTPIFEHLNGKVSYNDIKLSKLFINL